MKIEIQTKSGETFDTMKLNVPYISAHDDLEACVFVKIEGNRNRKPYLLEFTEGSSLPSRELVW